MGLVLFACNLTEAGKEKTIRDTAISAHRGGPVPGYPENALETLQRTSLEIPHVLLEVDVRASGEGTLILLHDETLDRTTTGSGPVDQTNDLTLEQLMLVDENGDLTKFHIPTLAAVFDWLPGSDAFLSLDIKSRSLFDPTLELVRFKGVLDRVEFITYSADAARQLYELEPEAHLSVAIRNPEELERIRAIGISGNQLAAFTGQTLRDESLYSLIHDFGAIVTLGTIGNLDRKAATQGDGLYTDWMRIGVDRIATDRPFVVYENIGP